MSIDHLNLNCQRIFLFLSEFYDKQRIDEFYKNLCRFGTYIYPKLKYSFYLEESDCFCVVDDILNIK